MYDENNLQELGINIKLLRARYKINQYELAQALEISQTHMSNIESGRVQINLRLLLRG
ncbi:helix-turn-helix transcriptional regulator [uncultured Phascolarctobacterium sp.]|uniref:helix-turn-helix domain-containing protein n=1 Tax=uncultured Phascolarctobacterium sp. TaxID=512296 RepID=UPI0025CD2A4A|nr:helix-turn-helix transcriptional regulator [uncultured Phascolarctobacterium sp.]